MNATDLAEYKVSKSNALVEAAYHLSLAEQRLVLMAIAQTDSRNPSAEAHTFRVRATDYAELFQLDLATAYEALADAAHRLYERSMTKITRPDEKTEIVEDVRWIDRRLIKKEQRFVTELEVSWSRHIQPYLTMLQGKYTSYELRQVIRLQSPYAIRVYEWLVRWIGTGEVHITLEEFRARLDLGKKYPRFADLKARVIQPAVDSINMHTNLDVDWEPIRKSRKVTRLLFVAAERRQGTLDLAPAQE